MKMADDALVRQRSVQRAENRGETEVLGAVVVAVADLAVVPIELHHRVVDVELLAAPLGLVDEVLHQVRKAGRARQQQVLGTQSRPENPPPDTDDPLSSRTAATAGSSPASSWCLLGRAERRSGSRRR